MRLSVKVCFAVLAVYAAAALLGEVQYRIAQYRDVVPSYNVVDTEHRYEPPSARHWMGTDNLGRDVAQRLVQGTRIAFHVGIITSLIAIPLGVLLGLLGGYYGGKADDLYVRARVESDRVSPYIAWHRVAPKHPVHPLRATAWTQPYANQNIQADGLKP